MIFYENLISLVLVFKGKLTRSHYAVFSPFNYVDAYSLANKEYSPSVVCLIGEGVPPDYGYHWFDKQICPWDTSSRWRHRNDTAMNMIYCDGSADI